MFRKVPGKAMSEQALYHVKDRVKVYFPGAVIRGEVIGTTNVSVEDDRGKYFCTVRAYLVMLDVHVSEERSYIITAPFLKHDRSKSWQ